MRASIGDRSYWYEIHGEGEVIVLLHGFTGTTETWSNFIEASKTRFKIIAIDLPGHGKTITHSNVTMKQCCKDIHELLKANGIETFHLVGYSMGGRTALSYALLYQEQLKSLILESASPGLELEKDRQARISKDEKLARKIEQEGIESFVVYWEDIPLFDSQKRLAEGIRKRIKEERLSQSKEGLAMSLRYMGTGKQDSLWHRLQELHIPVLLMVGKLDLKFIDINNKMHKSISTSELVVIENAGHAIHVELPEFFGKIVRKFILKVSNT